MLFRSGVEIPISSELVGLLDGEQRCAFAPLNGDDAIRWCPAVSEYSDVPLNVVQMLYPDRKGFLPYEAGYEQRMRFAQPVVGAM